MSLTAREQELCRRIEKRANFLLEDLRVHVSLPTGGNNQPALNEARQRLCVRLQKLGAKTENVPGGPRPDWLYGAKAGGPVPPTAVCRRPGRDPALKKILLVGHLDTVHDPNGPFRELSVSPDRKTATGPGCVDMKGGLVIMTAALEALEEVGIDASWTVALNSDEETGSYHSESALYAEASKADYGLVVEPALPGGELAIERPGSGQFMLEVHGRSAHVGRDFTSGVSAVNGLALNLLKIAGMPEPGRGLIVSVGPIDGGHATNVVPDRARAWGNIRYPDRQMADDIERRLLELATPDDALPRVIVRTSLNRPAKPLIPGTKALGERAQGAAEDLGQKLPFGRTGGVCDGNILQDAGLPTIDTLGVRGGGLHTPQEWIEIPSLVERCQLLAVLIARLTAGGA